MSTETVEILGERLAAELLKHLGHSMVIAALTDTPALCLVCWTCSMTTKKPTIIAVLPGERT